jgi:quinol monooxygenase YgiN
MFVHIWKMRARGKKVAEYEKFAREVTLPSLKKIDGCLEAHFIKVYMSRKPQYLWLVFWKDQEALEAAHSDPVWKEQIQKFEAGQFYKHIPVELLGEELAAFGASATEKPKKAEATGTTVGA